MRVGSLFAGIGGFDLAAQWMGWETIWYSEIDPYASAVMKKNFPTALNLGDITQIDGKQAPPVDLLCGGFPCQDISLAGKGAGLSGERSGLWSHYARLIEEIRPRYVVIENVSALRSRGLDRVLGEIAALGYDAEWHCIPAAYVGAPHRRDRLWILADSQREGELQQGGSVAHERGRTCDCGREGSGQRPGCWCVEPDVGRVAHGVPSRVDRLKCLGNAIVPQVAFEIFKAIEERERLK